MGMVDQAAAFGREDGRTEQGTDTIQSRDAGPRNGGLAIVEGQPRPKPKEIVRDAKAEYKQVKENATRMFEKKVDDVRSGYLAAKQQVKEEYEMALIEAKDELEFAVDIAKDQYKTIKKETGKIEKK